MDNGGICGECRYNKYDNEIGFFCANSESEHYGIGSMYDDRCDEWRSKYGAEI